jgi:hypothetical protein
MWTESRRVFLVAKNNPRRCLLVRMAGTFLDQPALRLTLPQAQRLWHLDASTCLEHLSELIGAQFLEVRDDRYQLTQDPYALPSSERAADDPAAARM